MRAAKVDDNHSDIVKELRSQCWSVVNLHRVGQGCPDIAVGACGHTFLAEIKSEKGKLNEDQEKFHAKWMGNPILILRNPGQAVAAVKDELKRLWARKAA